MVGGNVAYDEGVVKSTPGMGKYIGRDNLGYVYERVPALENQRRIRETPVDRSGKNEEASTLEDRIRKLTTELEISNSKINQLEQ